jgi:hypothetical protein
VTVTLLSAGVCAISANQAGDDNFGPATEVTRTFVVWDPNAGRVVNISTRADVSTGSDVLIGGFVIGGSTPKTVVIRAIGPSLAAYGIANPLANPMLQLFTSSHVNIATNDNWGNDPSASMISSSGFAPSHPLESAIYTTLYPGPYTAIVTGVGGSSGVALIEVYEVDRPEIPLVNISTRGRVETAEKVMIGGFVIQGNSPQTVVIRGIGPSLAGYGVQGVLGNPFLQLVRMSDQTVIASNDNWQSAANSAQLSASGFAPSNPLESALYITLDPGAYTAILSGVNNDIGVGLVEVYAVTQP